MIGRGGEPCAGGAGVWQFAPAQPVRYPDDDGAVGAVVLVATGAFAACAAQGFRPAARHGGDSGGVAVDGYADWQRGDDDVTHRLNATGCYRGAMVHISIIGTPAFAAASTAGTCCSRSKGIITMLLTF